MIDTLTRSKMLYNFFLTFFVHPSIKIILYFLWPCYQNTWQVRNISSQWPLRAKMSLWAPLSVNQ